MTTDSTPKNPRLLSVNADDLQADHAAIVEDLMGLSRQIDRIEHIIDINEQKALVRQSNIDDLTLKISRLEHTVSMFTEKIDKMKHELIVILVVIILGSEGASAAFKSWLVTNLAPTTTTTTEVISP